MPTLHHTMEADLVTQGQSANSIVRTAALCECGCARWRGVCVLEVSIDLAHEGEHNSGRIVTVGYHHTGQAV